MEFITSPNYDNTYATCGLQLDMSKIPIPNVFQIRKYFEYNGYTLLEVHYPNYTSYNGLVYLIVKATIEDIKNTCNIDPHFIENDSFISNSESKVEVIVRLKPSKNAWVIGTRMLRQLEIVPEMII